ncbi:MAG: 3-phosphoserine/phosphohydroxythreonine transaminase [Gammaproteobacteria bacterium]|nr:MAG: 3-phosphoserine/phosphohydroxythreonine transaminase [Gammaproteobacteria bacterium]
MSRVYNFSAGPAMLPTAVIEQAQAEMDDWQGTGMSVMEMSHRGKEFMSIAEHAETTLREIMEIPSNYKVLFLQGGASSQFSAVPMNLLRGNNKANYLNTGMWSKKAIAEGKRYCYVNVACTSEAENFSEIPSPDSWNLDSDAAYVHYTPNETIGGVEFHWVPDVGDMPLVADMSSTILSRPIPVERYGVIYAGAQKNVGPAGLTIVIVREDLMGDVVDCTPTMMNYQKQADADSMLNTPPTYGWYLAGLVFDWIKAKGGLTAMSEINERKATKLYDVIDTSDFYSNPVRPDCRSWMNVPFILADDTLNESFLGQAKDAGLVTLKGHRSVGGMRASIYNAMPEEGVDALVQFMQEFERTRA